MARRRILSLLSVVLIALLLSYIGPKDLAWTSVLCVYAVVAIYVTVALIRRERLLFAAVLFLASILVMVLAFGEIYFHRDLVAGNGSPVGLGDAIYFSMTSWTTSGYGDLHPVGAGKLIAATEAFVGYIYMGVFVALFYSVVERARASGASTRARSKEVA